MTDGRRSVIVIGSGIVGLACAEYLLRGGGRVTVIDRNAFGQGCSFGNCGLICPSHVLPLSEPGAVWKTLKSMLRPDSPLYIKPRWSPALWSWLMHFAWRCNHRDMLDAAAALHGLLQSSVSLYRELIAAQPIDCEWQDRGLLFVFRSRWQMEHYAETDRLLRESFQLPARRYDGEAVTELAPSLVSGLAGGWHYEHDAHLRPEELMQAWRRSLAQRGVDFRDGCELQGFRRAGRAAREIVTSHGELSADTFVVATGALTPRWSAELGCRIPIQPGKGYSITTSRPANCPAMPLIFPEQKVAVTPMQTGFRIGSTMEFAGYDATINRRRLGLLTRAAELYLQEPYGDAREEEWCGWRPMTYDGKPLIDRSPALENVFVAAGHNMIGISTAPATGRLIAELVEGSTPHLDPRPFSVRRFS